MTEEQAERMIRLLEEMNEKLKKIQTDAFGKLEVTSTAYLSSGQIVTF